LLLLAARPVQGDVALKPRGQNAAPLRMKRLEADAVLEKGRFATTNLDLVFQNTVHDRIEADFIYTVPEGAVVTDFAYYYGDERVVARVVEKERAAAIYHYITSRMRDPALVEMIGKNTFRARIFPVMPDADLRVQIRYVQVLPVTRGVASYTLPIETPRTERMESAKIMIHVKGSEAGTFTNNFGLPFVKQDDTEQNLTINQLNWRTNENLRVSFAPTKSTLHEAFYAAPSGGSDGFFALSVATPGAMTQPVARFAGVTTYDIETTRWSGGLLFTGRYKGKGEGSAIVSDGKVFVGKIPLMFTDTPSPNHPGVSLWASAHLARLSTDAKNAAAVIALSKRFNLPSKWTSWLAVPKAEIERFHREMAMAELSLIAGEMARRTVAGKGNDSQAQALRQRYDEQLKKMGNYHEGELPYFVSMALEKATTQAAQALGEEILHHREQSEYARNLRSLLTLFCRTSDTKPKEAIQNALSTVTWKTAEDLGQAIQDGEEHSNKARALRRRLNSLCRETGEKPGDILEQELSSELNTIATELVDEVAAHREAGSKARRMRSEFTRLSNSIGEPTDRYLHDALLNHTGITLTELTELTGKGQGNSPKAEELRGVVYYLAEKLDVKGRKLADQMIRQYAESAARQSAWSWANASHSQRFYDGHRMREATPESIEEMRLNVLRLSQVANIKPQTLFDEAEAPYKVPEYEQTRDRIVEERAKPTPNVQHIQELEAQFLDLARGDWWQNPYRYPAHWFYKKNTPEGRVAWSKDRLARIAAHADGEAIDRLLASNPDPAEVARLTAQRAALKRKEDEIHARMGDPLLQVVAPENVQSVVAQMPDGEIKPLAWNAANQDWEARFDIPTYAAEGDYTVNIVIVSTDGTRTTETRTYHVDVTPPTGKATITALTVGRWLLSVQTEEDVARITALLPDGQSVILLPEPGKPGHWSLVAEVPAEKAAGQSVTFVLTDRAHNRATLTATFDTGEEKGNTQ
jgi:hypothetical protein